MPRFTLGMGRFPPSDLWRRRALWVAGTRDFGGDGGHCEGIRRPWAPLPALSLPELTTMRGRGFICHVAWLTLTGSAQTWLVVNSPATAAGVRRREREGRVWLPLLEGHLPCEALMSKKRRRARKPFGSGDEPGMDVNFDVMNYLSKAKVLSHFCLMMYMSGRPAPPGIIAWQLAQRLPSSLNLVNCRLLSDTLGFKLMNNSEIKPQFAVSLIKIKKNYNLGLRTFKRPFPNFKSVLQFREFELLLTMTDSE